jgi:hypothetical protein
MEEKVVELFKMNKTPYEISQLTGLPIEKVYKILKDANGNRSS